MTRGSSLLALILGWGVALDGAAQSGPATHGASDRRALAVRINGAAPEIDGRLDDPVWGNAQPATGFGLREPTEGVSAPERTEVRFKQNRFENGLPTGNVGPGGLLDAFGAPGDHFLALKVSYWIPVR